MKKYFFFTCLLGAVPAIFCRIDSIIRDSDDTTTGNSIDVDIDPEPLPENSNVTVFVENTYLANPDAVAYTSYGLLRGVKKVSRHNRRFYSFFGVPYAAPPVGSLRFEPPLRPRGWNGIRDASRPGAQCTQVNIVTTKTLIGNEDCLYLNIFTHRLFSPHHEIPPSKLNGVLIFIHGGIFHFGGSNPYRPKYFMDENIVLVTINYRLASFGFLNTGDDLVPGNMGLKDQVMAMKWIKQNIIYFGGDPNRITVMGESAGAVSSHMHTLSPLSKGLFRNAVSMSGTALAPWSIIQNPGRQAKEFAGSLGCPTRTTKEMVWCLKRLDANKIAKGHYGAINGLAENKQSLFGPTVETAGPVDGRFLPAHPRDMMKARQINNVTWMNGVLSEEGLVYLIPIIRNSTMGHLLNTKWEKYAPAFLHLNASEVSPATLREIRRYYIKDTSRLGRDTIKQTADLVSDRAFFMDSHDAIHLHSKVADVYSYYYNYSGRFAMGKLLFVRSQLPFRLPDRYDFAFGSMESWFKEYVLGVVEPNPFGVGHSDELPLFFNSPIIRRPINDASDEDYHFSTALVHLWASFANTGAPDTEKLRWPRWWPIRFGGKGYRFALPRYFLNKSPKMEWEPFAHRLRFWKSRNIQ